MGPERQTGGLPFNREPARGISPIETYFFAAMRSTKSTRRRTPKPAEPLGA
jgi:hypothetical protein